MSHKFAFCSEVYDTPIEETIDRVQKIGFDGLEIAPFNIGKSVEDVGPERRQEIRKRAQGAGIEIIGLHWILVSPPGFHLTTADVGRRDRTAEYIRSLAAFCSDLGGSFMVLGSPNQRNLEPGTTLEAAFERAAAELGKAAPCCGDLGVSLLLEPLHANETNFLQTVEDALELVRRIDHPAVGYMLDCKAMSGMPAGIEGTLRQYGKDAGHFHTNEPGGKGPGMGDVDFRPIMKALDESGYTGWVSSEPFDYSPDPDTVARAALETLKAAVDN